MKYIYHINYLSLWHTPFHLPGHNSSSSGTDNISAMFHPLAIPFSSLLLLSLGIFRSSSFIFSIILVVVVGGEVTLLLYYPPPCYYYTTKWWVTAAFKLRGPWNLVLGARAASKNYSNNPYCPTACRIRPILESTSAISGCESAPRISRR